MLMQTKCLASSFIVQSVGLWQLIFSCVQISVDYIGSRVVPQIDILGA